MKNQTVIWARVLLYSLILMTITAHIAPMLIVFGTPPPQITELVPKFWNAPNIFYDYITANERYSNEIEEVLSDIAVIPTELQPLVTMPVYNYVFIMKKPTLKNEGTGIVEAKLSNGSTKKVMVKLNKLEQKSLPPITFNTYVQKTRDLVISGQAHAEVLLKSVVTLTDWEYFHKFSNVLSLLFYTENEFREWEYTVTHKDSGQTKKIADTQKNLYISQTDAIFQLKIKNSDSDLQYDANFDTELTACMKSGEKIKLMQKSDTSLMDPIVFAKKPSFVKVQHPREMLETEPFKIKDDTIAASKKVFVDFVELSESDTKSFFAGEYFFPLNQRDTIHSIEIVYTSISGASSSYCDHVITYTLKPRSHVALSGKSKENRALEATVETLLSEYAKNFVSVRSSISAKFSELNSLKEFYSAEASNTPPRPEDVIKYKTREADRLEFIATLPGRIEFDADTAVYAPAEYIQRSVPSDYFNADKLSSDTIIIPDLPPAVILLPYSLSMSRIDAFKYFSDAVSLDGDSIANCEIKLTKLPNEPIALKEDMKLELGQYRIELIAKEKMEGATYGELLPANYEKVSNLSREFTVDNYSPSTLLSLDANDSLPKVDITIVTDNIPDSEIISGQKVDMTNALREGGIDALINHHDRAVYTYSMRVYDSNNSGSSYPSNTYWYNKNGYKGTLSINTVSNNPRNVDRGSYKTVKNSHEVTKDVENNTSSPAIYTWTKGSWVLTQPWSGKMLANTISYSCRHGRVTLTKTDSYYEGDGKLPSKGKDEGEKFYLPFSFHAVYTGICTYTERVWEPKYVSVDDYTGHYSGTVQKSVVKTFNEQNRMFSDKLLVHFEQGGEAQIEFSLNPETGMQEVKFKGSAAELSAALLEYLKNTIIHENTVIAGSNISISASDNDLENDAISVTGIQIDHDPSVFQNPEPNASRSSDVLPSTLANAGKYTIKRSVSDMPPVPEYSKSADSTINITAHRRPVADFEADWLFENGYYSIIIDDKSADPDFEFDDDKGIATRVYRYKKADGEYIYKKPSQLGEGEYTISLAVKDRHGAWSDECTRNISLKAAPDVLLEAKLRGETADISSIPAGEKIIVYDIKSKYHDRHDIKIEAFGNAKIQNFESATSLGKDKYSWKDATLTIPDTTADGNYFVKISSFNNSELLLPLNINTPISIKGSTSQGEKLELRAVTNKYAKSVTAKIFAGTAYEREIALAPSVEDSEAKKWFAEFDIDALNIPDGIYTTEFTAVTAAGKQAADSITEEFVFLKIKSAKTSGAHNIWNTNRYMGYEKIEISVVLNKAADSVELRFSPELEAMNFKNSMGTNYSYREEFGYTVDFPIQMQSADNITWTAKYILPVAKSTIDWKDQVLREPYKMYIKAVKNKKTVEDEFPVDITGNVHDRVYIRPIINQ